MTYQYNLSKFFNGIDNRLRIEHFMCLQTKMSPSQFIHKWKITYSQLAEILDVDYVRIYGWMSPNKPVKVPSYYLAKIALADFFFEFYDFIPHQRLEDYLNN